MFSVLYVVWLFLMGSALALLEIQIEGEHGWAEKLPCWRPAPDSLAAKVFTKIMGGKPLTGYHIWLTVLMVAAFHLPFFAGVEWSIPKELWTISQYLLFVVYWDFLWFVWNPHYGLERFNSQSIWWHKDWLGPIPVDYVTGVGLSLIFAILSEETMKWGFSLPPIAALIFLSYVISQILRKKNM